ncbi:MAG: PilT/PilU family type 4a pilus ATPase [Nanoarchaeota archaeon]
MDSRPIPERISERVYNGRSLAEMLNFSRDYGASDIKFVVGLPPYFRRGEGLVHNLGDGKGAFEPVNLETMNKFVDCLTTQKQRDKLLSGEEDLDMSVIMPENDGARSYRLNLAMQKGTPMIMIRVVPDKIRPLSDLGLPKTIIDYFRTLQRGIVLVTGATGAGKSSTLAAMVDDIRVRNSDEIITIEDPIEYVHNSDSSLIIQRELRRDTQSYSSALKSAMRQDPDVIAIGEIRDTETVRACLESSYTGHLVLGTLHTADAIQSVNRMIDLFPESLQRDISSQLSDTLRIVISQSLVPTINGGRKLVAEILRNDPFSAISKQIRDRDPPGKILSSMQTGKRYGMVVMEDALFDAYQANLIDKVTAFGYAIRKDEMKRKLDFGELGK